MSGVIARGLCRRHGALGICKSEGCKQAVRNRGLCSKHCGRGVCKARGCSAKIAIRGLCSKHATLKRRRGSSREAPSSRPRLAEKKGFLGILADEAARRL